MTSDRAPIDGYLAVHAVHEPCPVDGWTANLEVMQAGPTADTDLRTEGTTMSNKISKRFRLVLAAVTGIAAGIARTLAERTLDLFTH